MDVLTGGVFAPREISRVTVMQGHEDDTLLNFFPSGFICHDGPYMPIGDRINAIKEKGCFYKI